MPTAEAHDNVYSLFPAAQQQQKEETINDALEQAFHLTGVAQYLEYYECN